MLKKWSILWLIAIVCLPLVAQDPEPEGTRIAWIYDLPGVVAVKGARVRLGGPVVNQAANKQMVITIVGDSSVPAAFASLLRQRQALTRLRIVEGKARIAAQTEYTLSNVRIRSVTQSQVVLGYDRIESRMLLSSNPGPPAGAPPVARDSANTLWAYGLAEGPVALTISDFTARQGEGSLRVRMAECAGVPPEIERLVKEGAWSGELILVIPDKRIGRYVEYKLWDGEVSADAESLTFRAARIEILGGID